LNPGEGPWLEALLGFAQVDESGKVDALPEQAGTPEAPDSEPWQRLRDRLQKLLHVR
jgi:hypothetical protein